MKSALFICLLGIAITLAFGASATDGRSKKRRLPGARIPLENSGGLAEAVLDSIQAQNVQEQLHHTKRWCRGCTYPLEGDGNQAEMVQKRIEKVQKEESAQTVTPDVQDADSKQRRKRETGTPSLLPSPSNPPDSRDAQKKGRGKLKERAKGWKTLRGDRVPLENSRGLAETVLEMIQARKQQQQVTPDAPDTDSKQRRKRETGYRDAPKKVKGKGKGRKRKPNTTSIYHPFSGTGDQASAVQQRLNSKLQEQPSFLLL
ncbi:uncharacterized protein [Lepisosteus oculatus]|uniref:uncharacterized protein isoform X2 n=1 Tax=Lepisosteus oculatus TaxID=7918 RepID=UPI003713B092